MSLTRRTLLAANAAAGTIPTPTRSAQPPKLRFGIASTTYAQHLSRKPELKDPVAFLKFCADRGAAGAQIPLQPNDLPRAERVRALCAERGLTYEGQVRMPREKADLERFEAELRAAKAAGASVARSVLLSGRRYETFRTAEEFRTFRTQSLAALELAEPAAARNRIKLAVENHKDFRAGEQVEWLRRLSSEWLGVCLDTGNNMALLESAEETTAALSPYTRSVHLKDMATEPYEEGFLLSEVPLGKGVLDLRALLNRMRASHPLTYINIEMITRDPLKIPCLTPGYWETLTDVSGARLAGALRSVKELTAGRPLPRESGLPPDERLAREDRFARECLSYAHQQLA